MKEQKRCSKTIDIVSYALEVSVGCVMGVYRPFQVSTKTCDTDRQ